MFTNIVHNSPEGGVFKGGRIATHRAHSHDLMYPFRLIMCPFESQTYSICSKRSILATTYVYWATLGSLNFSENTSRIKSLRMNRTSQICHSPAAL